jgi:cbb3-type cytochrome oxidase subunit 3
LALLETLSFQIVFTALLGYLAWLYRRHARSAAGSQP